MSARPEVFSVHKGILSVVTLACFVALPSLAETPRSRESCSARGRGTHMRHRTHARYHGASVLVDLGACEVMS